MTSRTVKSVVTGGNPTSRVGGSEDWHVVEPANAAELVDLEARAAHQGAVDILLRHDAGDVAADGVRVLYGGSVKASNVGGIMVQADVDGCLVGGASLQTDEFGGICRFYDMPVL